MIQKHCQTIQIIYQHFVYKNNWQQLLLCKKKIFEFQNYYIWSNSPLHSKSLSSYFFRVKTYLVSYIKRRCISHWNTFTFILHKSLYKEIEITIKHALYVFYANQPEFIYTRSKLYLQFNGGLHDSLLYLFIYSPIYSKPFRLIKWT